MSEDRPPRIVSGEPWLIDLRDTPTDKPTEITSEWGGLNDMRWIISTQEKQDATIFVVDKDNEVTAMGLDGSPRDMIVDTEPCSCNEYRKQGIEEGWIDE